MKKIIHLLSLLITLFVANSAFATPAIINQSISSNFGVNATAWVVTGHSVNYYISARSTGPNMPGIQPSGNITVSGYATSSAFTAGDQPLAVKTYVVPSADLSSVFSSGDSSILTYVESLSDFTGATVTAATGN